MSKKKQRKNLFYNNVPTFDREEFIKNVCNDKYVLVIGSEVVLDKEKHSDVNGDILQYILKALNNNLGIKEKKYTSLDALVSSRPSISTLDEPSGADLIRNFLFSEWKMDEDTDDETFDDEVDNNGVNDETEDDVDETEWMYPPTITDLSPELYELIDTRLFRFVMTTTFDANVEFLMKYIWKDELRVVNIANQDDWKKFRPVRLKSGCLLNISPHSALLM